MPAGVETGGICGPRKHISDTDNFQPAVREQFLTYSLFLIDTDRGL